MFDNETTTNETSSYYSIEATAAAESSLNYQINGTGPSDVIAWKGANTAFLVVLFTAIPLMAGLVSLLVCKLYGLRRIVAPLNNFDGIELPISQNNAAAIIQTNEKRGSPI